MNGPLGSGPDREAAIIRKTMILPYLLNLCVRIEFFLRRFSGTDAGLNCMGGRGTLKFGIPIFGVGSVMCSFFLH